MGDPVSGGNFSLNLFSLLVLDHFLYLFAVVVALFFIVLALFPALFLDLLLGLY